MKNTKILISAITASVLLSACGTSNGETNKNKTDRNVELLELSPTSSFVAKKQDGGVSWDKQTVFDKIGKMADLADESFMKKFGMTKFGVDLQTAERIINLSANNNFLVAISKYHNALTVIDYAKEKPTFEYGKFASFRVNYSTGKGGLSNAYSSTTQGVDDLGDVDHGGSDLGGGSVVDVSSGGSSRSATITTSDESCKSSPKNNHDNLWEHSLEDARITSNGKYVYALVLPRFSTTYSHKKSTFGLFRAEVGYCGINPYNAKSTKQINSQGIKSFELSSNNQLIAIYGEKESEKTLRTRDASLNLIKSVKVDSDIVSLDFALDDSIIVASIKSDLLNKPKIMSFNAQNLQLSKEKKIPFTLDVVLGAKNKIVGVSKEKRKIVIFNSDLDEVDTLTLGFTISKIAISPNGSYIALGNDEAIYIYTVDKYIKKLVSAEIDGLRAISFVDNKTIAYTPKLSANSVRLITIEKKTSDEIEEPQEDLISLGEFSSFYSLSDNSIIGTTKLVASYGDRLMSYTRKSKDKEGFNVFDLSSNELEFTQGGSVKMRKITSNHDRIILAKMINAKTFVYVTTNDYMSGGGIYVQNLLSNGEIEYDFSKEMERKTLTKSFETSLAAKISKDSKKIFIVRKHSVYKDYFVDIYSKDGEKYVSFKDVKMKHLSGHDNTIAPNDDGSYFYSINDKNLYKNSVDGIENKVGISNANGVYFGLDSVFVSTSNGKLYMLDKDLSSKKAYSFGFANIKDIQFNDDKIVVFASNGVYILKKANGKLSAYKKMDVENLTNGYVQKNKIFAVSTSGSFSQSKIYYSTLD